MQYIAIYICRGLVVSTILITGCSTIVEAPVETPGNVPKARKPTVSQSRIQTEKGYHIVDKGDTLYSIAWHYAKDYKDIAHWNAINPPYTIFPEQVIRLKPPVAATTAAQPANKEKLRKTRKIAAKSAKETDSPAKKKISPKQTKVVWYWPTEGKLLRLNSPTSKKGVNISGKLDQTIKAAASGEVVYSGSGLLGYGKLIIIKHNETYLSAYAHNNRILVKEGMKVSRGQKIATMGIGNNGKPLLHFEIRMNGKPVNPIQHLPERRS